MAHIRTMAYVSTIVWHITPTPVLIIHTHMCLGIKARVILGRLVAIPTIHHTLEPGIHLIHITQRVVKSPVHITAQNITNTAMELPIVGITSLDIVIQAILTMVLLRLNTMGIIGIHLILTQHTMVII